MPVLSGISEASCYGRHEPRSSNRRTLCTLFVPPDFAALTLCCPSSIWLTRDLLTCACSWEPDGLYSGDDRGRQSNGTADRTGISEASCYGRHEPRSSNRRTLCTLFVPPDLGSSPQELVRRSCRHQRPSGQSDRRAAGEVGGAAPSPLTGPASRKPAATGATSLVRATEELCAPCSCVESGRARGPWKQSAGACSPFMSASATKRAERPTCSRRGSSPGRESVPLPR
jgi:hypothetical protein